MAVINLLVEGDLDEAAAARVVGTAGHIPGVCYGKKGLGYISTKVRGFNNAVEQVPCLALVDFMDTGFLCPPEVVTQMLPNRHPNMLLRIVVRELESWLLADRRNISRFLLTSLTRVPTDPENLPDPKRALVNLARRSSSRKIKLALVPEQGSTAQVGRLYTSEIKRFINETWDVQAARAVSPSLESCLRTLERLV